MFPVLLPELAPYRDRYDGLTGTPLRVTAVLVENAPVVAYDPVHLDSLLARAVVEEATQGRGVPPMEAGYLLPLPLAALWQNADGFPLHAATVFQPVGTAEPDTVVLHKRAQSGRWTGTQTGQFAVKTTAGRWMDRRAPVPATVCAEWEAFAWGDAAEVARLLALLPALGKRRGCGFGSVRHWRVEAWPCNGHTAAAARPCNGHAAAAAWEAAREPAALLIRDGRLTRPLPEAARELLGGRMLEGQPSLVGWTPPPWKPALWSPGWRAGTPVS